MKDIVEFLGIDILALQKTKKGILLNGGGTMERMMLLRLAARHVDVQGFFEEDFAFDDVKLMNKKIYNGEEIGGSNDEYLLLDCVDYKDKNAGGGGGHSGLSNLTYYPLAKPLRRECIIYGAGYQGRQCCKLMQACGVEVLSFCDRDSSLWQHKLMGKKIISPAELKAQYAYMPVMIALDPSIAEPVAEELYRDKVVSDAYLVCDAIFSISITDLLKVVDVKNKKRILWGEKHRMLMAKSVLEFLGVDVAYVIDNDGDGEAVKSPYDLCYENPAEVVVLVEESYKANIGKILDEAGISKSILLYKQREIVRKDGYEYLDPNLGHNIHSRGKTSVISLQTSKKESVKTIGVLGGSTSDIDLFRELSWPEQLIEIAEKHQKGIKILGGGVASYIVSQEIVKFLRDMSFKKMDVLISYSGVNDAGQAQTVYHNFVSDYQKELFSALAASGQVQNLERTRIKPAVEMPLGIEDIGEHWLHYEYMLYAMCKELGIKFYAVFQPNLTTKNHISKEEYIYSMINIDWMKKLQKTTEIIRSSVRKKMSIYPWLYDFSDIFADCPETVYFDTCHLTSHGNRILAEKIYALIADEL